MRKLICLVLSGALLVSMPAVGDVCSDMSQIYQESQNSYNPWKGRYDSEDERFVSSFKLPGAESCNIEDSYSLQFSCFWPAESLEQMLEDYSVLVQEASKCRPSGQPATTTVNSMEDSVRSGSTFEMRSTDLEITEVRYSHASNNFRVMISRGGHHYHSKRRNTTRSRYSISAKFISDNGSGE